jgi:hypothetical protein
MRKRPAWPDGRRRHFTDNDGVDTICQFDCSLSGMFALGFFAKTATKRGLLVGTAVEFMI